MSGGGTRKLLLSLFALCAAALIMARAYWPIWDDFRTPNARKGNPSLTLDPNREIQQVVLATGAELSAIAFWLDDLPSRGKAKLKLHVKRRENHRWVTMLDRRIPLRTLHDRSQPARIMLRPALKLRIGEPIAIALSIEATTAKPVRWRITKDFEPQGFRLYVDNHERTGTAQLRLDYSRASGPLLLSLDRVYARLSVLSGPVGKTFFFAGLLLLLFALALAFFREPETREEGDEAQRALDTTKQG